MYKPRMEGQALIFNAPSVVTLTNANVDAIDFPQSSLDIYGNTHTATVPDDFSEIVYRNTATDLDLTTQMSMCVGLFISANQSKKNVLYQFDGAFSSNGGATGMVVPIVGRASSNTIVASLTAPDNLLSTYRSLPSTNRMITSAAEYVCNCKAEVIKKHNTANTYPYFFGFLLMAQAGFALDSLFISMTVRAYVNELSVFMPSR